MAGTTMNRTSTGRIWLLSILTLSSAAVMAQPGGRGQGGGGRGQQFNPQQFDLQQIPSELQQRVQQFEQQGAAQDLTLFQETEGSGRGGMVQIAAPSGAQEPSGSALVLKGIYRFGDTYHVSLGTSDGGVVKATWKSGDTNPVSVANGYQIQLVDSRTVTLGLPAGMNCQSNAQSGTNCLGRNQLALSFSETSPTSSRRGSSNRGGNNNDTVSFIRDRGGDFTGGADIRALFEAAQSGDPRAAATAEAMIRDRIGNRGGGNNNGGGGRGGRGGGNFGGGGFGGN